MARIVIEMLGILTLKVHVVKQLLIVQVFNN